MHLPDFHGGKFYDTASQNEVHSLSVCLSQLSGHSTPSSEALVPPRNSFDAGAWRQNVTDTER